MLKERIPHWFNEVKHTPHEFSPEGFGTSALLETKVHYIVHLRGFAEKKFLRDGIEVAENIQESNIALGNQRAQYLVKRNLRVLERTDAGKVDFRVREGNLDFTPTAFGIEAEANPCISKIAFLNLLRYS
ncbi:MAG: hypothetical protein RBG13Loki_0153 [Promethearchaeota archaeon CR_4]|nr:MAG: hypothetical protein RBG13Loki_0153 [Candidatus Lokiarchaeota archaeon CR_4]